MPEILITGAAGSLGGLLARHDVPGGAVLCEAFALVARTQVPLTRDFVRLGRVPHWGDTARFRSELVAELAYPTLETGLSTL